MFLGDTSQGGECNDAGISENDIDSPVRTDSLVEAIQISGLCNVSLNTRNVAANCFDGLIEFLLTTSRDEDIGALLYKELCRSQPYPSGATCNDCHFVL